MASNMFLYWGSGSIPCWKPMLVLEEKNLQGYGQKLVSFSKKEHKCEDVMKINPRGQVPTFKDGDIVINESGAICDYLEYKYADQGQCLLPKDFALRAKVLQRVNEIQNLHKAMVEGILYYFFRTKAEDIDQAQLESKWKDAKAELQRWEEYIKAEGEGSFLVGKDFSMADVYFFPYLALGTRGKLNLKQFPSLNAYYKRVVDRPSVQATWPPHWIEEEAKEFFKGM